MLLDSVPAEPLFDEHDLEDGVEGGSDVEADKTDESSDSHEDSTDDEEV